MTDPELLGVRPDATADELKARFRALARLHHPDRGGDPAAFDLYRQAYERLLARAPERRSCSSCRGTGRVRRVAGFHVMDLPCPSCGGSGEDA